MVVFTVIGIAVSVVILFFFSVIGYGEFMYWLKPTVKKLLCRTIGCKTFNRKGIMHDYCLRCGR